MDIFEKIKNFVASHKKVSIAILVLTLVSAICISSYVVSINKPTVNTEKVAETTNKDTTVKKDETKKSDEKKNDTKKDEKKEDKKSDVTENKTTTTDNTVTEENKTVENKNVENTSNTTSNNVSNSTTNNSVSSQPTSTPCVPTYTTVNHPEQGHYETQVVSQAWDEPVYARKIVGGHTGRVYNSLDEFAMQEEDGNYSVKDVQVDTIHHDAVTQQVWVVDQQAWTETVASGC